MSRRSRSTATTKTTGWCDVKTGIRKFGGAQLLIREASFLPAHMRSATREVHKLEVPLPDNRRQGFGTELMHLTCAEADKSGVTLILECEAYGPHPCLETQPLADWYCRRFGFMPIQAKPLLLARMPGSTPRRLSLNPITAATQLMKAR